MYKDKCEDSYHHFANEKLPAAIMTILLAANATSFWALIDNVASPSYADAIGQWLAEILICIHATSQDKCVAAWCISRVCWTSPWVQHNRDPLCDVMLEVFDATQPWGAGRGRLALAIGVVGGGGKCREALGRISDHKEKNKLLLYVGSNLDTAEASALFAWSDLSE